MTRNPHVTSYTVPSGARELLRFGNFASIPLFVGNDFNRAKQTMSFAQNTRGEVQNVGMSRVGAKGHIPQPGVMDDRAVGIRDLAKQCPGVLGSKTLMMPSPKLPISNFPLNLPKPVAGACTTPHGASSTPRDAKRRMK